MKYNKKAASAHTISEGKRNVIIWLHLAAFMVHMIFGAITVGFGVNLPRPDGTHGPLYSSLFFGVDHSVNNVQNIVINHFQQVPFLAGFEFGTALSHFITFAIAKTRPKLFFDDWLANKMQPIRWVEYSITDAWISFSFLNLIGVTNLLFLLSHAGLKTSMNLMGLVCEYFHYLHNKYLNEGKKNDHQLTSTSSIMVISAPGGAAMVSPSTVDAAMKGVKKQDYRQLLTGAWICFYIAWIPYLFALVSRIGLFALDATAGGIPAFVWVSFLGYQGMEFIFPFILASSLTGFWIFEDYANVEIAFLATSLTVKLFFDSDVTFGILGSSGNL